MALSTGTFSFSEAFKNRNINSVETVYVFGTNDSVGTTPTAVANNGGIIYLPNPTTATTLRVAAGGNPGDIFGGPGAWTILIEGIDKFGNAVTDELQLAGASASASTVNEYIRFNKASVNNCGSYADQVTPPYIADITIENTAGTQTWAVITGVITVQIAIGVSQNCTYSTPNGKRAYLYSMQVFSDSGKVTTAYLFTRGGITETSAPYTSPMAPIAFDATGGEIAIKFDPTLPYIGPNSDIGVYATVSAGSGKVSAGLTLLVTDDV